MWNTAGMEAMAAETKSGGNVNEEVTSLAAVEFEGEQPNQT
jgi:hypothetical protein